MALSHLLYTRSSLQMSRIWFQSARRRRWLSVCSNGENDDPPQLKKEAVAEETSVVAAEPFVKESTRKISNFFSSLWNEMAYHGSKKTKTLTDVFREHKDDQTATTSENEETKPEETLSDVLLNFVKKKNTQSEYSSHLSDSDNDHLKNFPPARCENDLLEYQNVRYEGDEMSSPSESIEKEIDLKDCYVNSPDEQQEAREIVKPGSPTFEHLNEPYSEDAENSFHIQGLVDFLRLQYDVPSNSTSKTDSSNGNSWIEDSEKRNLNFNSTDGTELDASAEVSVSPSNKDQKELKNRHIARKISEENKVLVRFLPRNFTKSKIYQYFGCCGEILEVEFPYAEGQPLLKVAYIYFKTREGLEEAIKKSGLVVSKRIITVESATSMEMTAKIPIPSLIGDPDVPTALVKNPTRTIKIEQLTRGITPHDIEEALSFCESKVTGYFMGSSHSVAYVEFETEIGKERALAKQSIDVLGRHLVMLRIDSPRTTVVRISNMESPEVQIRHIHSICRSLGDVKFFFSRKRDILDVYFGISEWPNMWKILNGLNGTKVEDIQLQAEPAPIFPPEILLALWHRPEERKHLKATAQNLLGKIVGGTRDDTSAFASLENVFADKF